MYTLEGRKCGTIRFEPTTTGVVNSEDVTRSSTITDNPVEGGSNIQDHVFHQPLSFQISGVAINGADTISALQKMWKSGDIITYTGRNRIENLVIQQLRSTHDAAHKTGFSFTATLKQITLGSSEGSGTSTMVEQDTAAAASLPAPARPFRRRPRRPRRRGRTASRPQYPPAFRRAPMLPMWTASTASPTAARARRQGPRPPTREGGSGICNLLTLEGPSSISTST